MAYKNKKIETYNGLDIRLLEQSKGLGCYFKIYKDGIPFSFMAFSSVEAAKRCIDTYYKKPL